MNTSVTGDNTTLVISDGYKQTVVGIIPDDWEIATIGQMTSLIGDGIHSTPKYSNDGQFYFVNGNNLSSGMIEIHEETKRTSLEEYEKYKKPLTEQTILLSINGTIGNVGYYKNESIVLGKSAAFINVKANIDKSFVFYSLQSESTILAFNDGQTGSTIKNLGLGTIRNTVLPLPKKKEQTAIANALSDVDALLNELEKLIAKKQAIKTATMQQLLTGKTRLPDFSFHTEGDLKGQRKGTKPSELGEIPEDWEVKELGCLGKFKNGINKNADAFGHGFPFVNLMDVFGNHQIIRTKNLGLIDSTELDRKEYNLTKGDVLFIRSSVKPSGVGLTAVVKSELKDTVYSGFLIRYRTEKILDIEFKKYCFHNEEFRKQIIAASTVSANTNINQNALKSILLMYPNCQKEQTAIAIILSDMDEEIQTLKQRLSKTKQIKQGMMQQLLTGKTRLPFDKAD